MPHVSRVRLEKKTEKQLLQTLELVFTKVSKEEDMMGFMLSLLTQTEQLMLAQRFAVIILLNEGYSDSEISNSLHVTRVTVSRLRYYLESRGGGFKVAFRVLENEKLLIATKKALFDLLGYASRAAGGRVKPTIF